MRSWLPSDRPLAGASIERRLSDLHELTLRLYRSADRRVIVEQAVAWVAGLGCGALLVQPGVDDTLHIVASAGLSPPLLTTLQAIAFTHDEHTLVGYAALHRCVLLVEDIGREQCFADARALADDGCFRAALALPLPSGDCHAAALLISVAGDLDPATIGLFELLARQLAQALENAAAIAASHAHVAQLERRYSQLRRAYDLIAAERRTLATVLECAGDAILVTDAEGGVQIGNRAIEAVLGIHPDVLIGQTLEQAPVPAGLAALIGRARACGEQQDGTLVFPGDRTFHISVAPVQSFDEPPQAYVVLFRDITSFKQLEELKNRFVTTVSHDMKSPLHIINSYAELLKLAGPLSAEQAEYARRIRTSVQRLSALVSDLLDLARIELGVGMRAAPVEIGAITCAAVEELLLAADSKRIDLQVRQLPRLPLVWGDASHLRQVVSNLIANALAYTPHGGAVWLSAEASASAVTVRVEDSGIGISQQDIAQIFEPFFRASTAQEINSEGTGLGLAIVRRIVEEHGGTVGVESAINGGSTFWFRLPVADHAM